MAKNNLREHDHSNPANGGEAMNPESIHGGGPVVDGDGTLRRIWVIENGASDPADATATDIILEKKS